MGVLQPPGRPRPARRRSQVLNDHLPLLEDLPGVEGQSILVRADLNVPIETVDGVGTVGDDFRIQATLPTLDWLLGRGARVTLCSHLGRPSGRDTALSMDPVRRRLADMAPGVELVENLRFDPGEEANDPAFVSRLVSGHQGYVNDAFGASHRRHASIVGPPALLPSAAGRLVQAEVDALNPLVSRPARPFVAIIGGAKVSDKLGLLGTLVARADVVLIGGAMAFTFLVALGHEVGESLVEPDQVEACRGLLDSGRRIVVPTDVVAEGPGPDPPVRTVTRTIPEGWAGMDIGPATASDFAEEISGAGTVFWNGPMGRFEDPRFLAGTRTVAQAVASCGGHTVVGGGDSAAALAGLGLSDQVDHVSTGGGAALMFVETGDLPGLAALRESFARRHAEQVDP